MIMGHIKPYYDKILDVLGTFAVIAWMDKIGYSNMSIIITVFILQLFKTAMNRCEDVSYKPYGDWIANCIGWIFSFGFLYWDVMIG